MINRREFGKRLMQGAGVLTVADLSMGVSCGSIFTDIDNYVPIGLESFDEILTLIAPAEATLLAPVILVVKAAFADLTAAVTQYENAPAANKQTLIGKITTAINDVIQNLQTFWSNLNLPAGNLVSTIEGVLQIVLSTLAAFLPILGGTVTSVTTAKIAKLSKTIQIVPVAKSQLKPKAVKVNINNVFTKYGYQNHIY